MKKLFFSLVPVLVIIACTPAQPKLEDAHNPGWLSFLSLPEEFYAERMYNYDNNFFSIDGDDYKGIGTALCSTDAASIEAAKYLAIAGLVNGIIVYTPEDTVVHCWPELVYELNSLTQIKVERLGKRKNGQVICIVSIKKSEAEKIQNNLRDKYHEIYNGVRFMQFFREDDKMNATYNRERMKFRSN
ncbi:MAG: hypothetical protein LBH44_04140 [Treponema sp.]|jgi:hypothetical protein|nr:hypothetical protein [Treponema sp.]